MLLMTAGPIAVDQRVIAAMNRPAVYHQTPEFWEVIDDVGAMLQRIFLTESPVAVGPGSGRLGLESAMVSVLEPGDRTLHVVNGTFAAWSEEIARRAGAETTRVEGREGGPLELGKVREALRAQQYKLVTVCHSETSTGALYDLQELASLCHAHGALVMVDAISSVGCMEMRMDDWDLDLVVTTSNKGLGALVGLAVIGVGPRAFAAMDARQRPCQSYGLDLKRWRASLTDVAPRPYPVVPFTHLYFALQEGCRQVLEEGLEARWARHARFAEATRRAVEAMGLEVFPERALAGNCVTAVRVPDELTEAGIVGTLAERYQVIISGSMPGRSKGKLFRISHQGVQASREMLIPTLVALGETLTGLGYRVDTAGGIDAFERTLENQT